MRELGRNMSSAFHNLSSCEMHENCRRQESNVSHDDGQMDRGTLKLLAVLGTLTTQK